MRTRHWQELQRCGKAYRHVLPTDALRPRDFGKGSAQGGVGAVAVDGVEELGLKLGTRKSAQSMMKSLSEVKATLVRVRTQERGRRATVMLAPDLTAEQRKSVKGFELGRWMPILLSSRRPGASDPDEQPPT